MYCDNNSSYISYIKNPNGPKFEDNNVQSEIHPRHYFVSNIPNCPLNPCQILCVSAFNEHRKWSNQKYLLGKLPFVQYMRNEKFGPIA